MFLRQIFDPSLAQYAYLIGCQKTGEALIIDPERDVQRYIDLAEESNLRLTGVAETHIHADFVSGSQELAALLPDIQLHLSAEGGADWTYQWSRGRNNVHLLRHGDTFKVGNILMEAVHSPGHTPEHLSYSITDIGGGADQPMALATGDFLFVGDVGRPDLMETAAGAKEVMEPSARGLRESLVKRLDALPDFLQILPGHGAGSACGKSLGSVPITTLGYERRFNGALKSAHHDKEQFVKDILAGQPEPPLYFARMKRVNRDGIAVTGGPARPRRLSAEEAATVAEQKNLRILDLRNAAAEFDAGHLKRSIHAPFPGSFFLMAAGSYISEDERILLVLEHSSDAEKAVTQLYRIGLDQVAGWVTLHDLDVAGLLAETSPRIDFAEWDRSAADGVILDVRNSSEFAAGHLDGAVSLPYTRLRARLDEAPHGKRLLVHCGSGKRSALAASFLRAEGFDAVHIDGICTDCERIAQKLAMAH